MEVASFLKYIFLLHFIVSIVFGFFFFLGIEIYVDLMSWPFLDPVAGRVMGAMLIGFGVSSFLGYKAASWEEVKIIVLAEIIWCLIATIAQIWMFIAYPALPLAGWLNLALFGIFFILFAYAYYVATR